MIQFNLLPDVKKEYIKAKRTKRVITSISTLAIVVSIAIVGVLFSVVQLGQKSHISDLTADIQSKVTEINEIEDLDKILTIQNQLESLGQLHQDKPETSRLFSYFAQLTPEGATIANLTVDFESSSLVITGEAADIATVNRFADTLKFTKFTYNAKNNEDTNTDAAEELQVFTSVLTQVSRSETDTSYILDTVFDPLIFDNTQNVTLRIPDQFITTRSVLNSPDIFEESNIDIDTILPEDGSSGN